MRGRLVPVLYWIALVMLLAGAVLLLVGDDGTEADHLGQVIAGLAWPIAAVGAVLDTVRHQRREDLHERSEAGPDEGRRLRSEP